MTPNQLLKHYKTQQAAANAIGVGQPAVAGWVRRGAIPPLRQVQFHRHSGGKLIVSKGISFRVDGDQIFLSATP